MNEPRLRITSARPPDTASSVEKRWNTRTGSSELRTVTAEPSLIRRVCPAILELASDDDIAAFVRRPGHHVGRMASCSQLQAYRAVLLGDAAAAFTPIGQGVNAAMESATVLDRCIGQAGDDLLRGAARYDEAWKPEADAVSWIAQRVLFEEPLNMLRSGVTVLKPQCMTRPMISVWRCTNSGPMPPCWRPVCS